MIINITEVHPQESDPEEILVSLHIMAHRVSFNPLME
jgi:hypothetical protein